MGSRVGRLRLLVVGLLAAAGACSSGKEAFPCAQNRECPTGWVCDVGEGEQGVCRQGECVQDADCTRPAAPRCDLALNRCVAASAPGDGGTDAGPMPDGGPASVLSVSPGAHTFDPVAAGSGGASFVFTVSNASGSGRSGTLAATLGGSDPTDFEIAGGTCVAGSTSLAAGASCSLPVRFHPGTIGPKSASLTVSANPGGSSMAQLVGQGVAPGALVIQPNGCDFETVHLGLGGGPFTFTVANAGGVASGPLALSISGPDSGHFGLSGGSCVPGATRLGAGEACTADVTFAPTDYGERSAALVASADPGGEATASLIGTTFQVSSLALDPSGLDFGPAAVEPGASSTGELVLYNAWWYEPSGPISLRITGANAGDFSLAGGTCVSGSALGTDESCTVSVRFAPTTGGAKTAVLSAVADPGGTTMAVLSGLGVARTTVSVGNASGSTLTDYQVLVALDTSAWVGPNALRADCGNLRLRDSDDATPLAYWLESGCGSAATRVWAKVPSLPPGSRNLYMHILSPSQTSQSSGDATFVFYADWENAVPGDWVDVEGFQGNFGRVVAEGGGNLVETTGGGEAWILLGLGDFAISAELRKDDLVTGSALGPGLVLSAVPFDYTLEWRAVGLPADGVARILSPGPTAFDVGWAPMTKRVLEVRTLPTWIGFYFDGTLEVDNPGVNTGSGQTRTLRIVGTAAAAAGARSWLDRVIVRRYASPEPVATVQ